MILWNDNWTFIRTPADGAPAEKPGSGAPWQAVDIPHDWTIHDTSLFDSSSEGWYRKTFACNPVRAGENCRRYYLRFDGVYMDWELFVNGARAGEWKYGYTTATFEISSFLITGENEVVVHVRNQKPNSRWYSGAGIYRNVRFAEKPAVHIAFDGVYVAAKLRPGSNNTWNVHIETELDVAGGMQGAYTVAHEITGHGGRCVATHTVNVPDHTVDVQSLTVENPELWDTENPALYTVKTTLYKDGRILDTSVNPLGFRTLEFTADNGFFLNGRAVKLHGACLHHDLGCLGAAVNKHAIRRQFELLLQMGVNAVRTAHNMPAVEFMELADEMGILVVSEGFDMWEREKTPYDYARFFPRWAEADTASWIRRDRNHPSLLLWSIGNEIYDTHAGERGLAVMRQLIDLVKKHDPQENAAVTLGSNYMPWENTQKCADVIKLIGYNYGEKYYAPHHSAHPDWIIYGSETCSVVQSRGIYHFPFRQQILCDDDAQCSALGNSATSWGAQSIEKCIITDRDTPYSAGMFIWSGFDYIGEPTPYHTKNSYFGQIDTAGFPKDGFYIFQAAWTPFEKRPLVHLFPFWDFNEGQTVDVRACSNAPCVELFVNGVSYGVAELGPQNVSPITATWRVPYAKGEIKAVAYGADGVPVAEAVEQSFGDAAALTVTVNKKTLTADGQDLAFVEISAVDSNGIAVKNANNRVFVTVTGAGRLIGLDNGNSADFESYKGTDRRLFSGKLLAVVAAGTEAGTVTLEVRSPSLRSAVLQLTVTAPEKTAAGISCAFRCSDTGNAAAGKIPVRRITLRTGNVRTFSPGCREITVTAEIAPENAHWRDLAWSTVTDSGAESNIASAQPLPGTSAVRVTANGDGAFRLRCTAANGTNRAEVISELDFTAAGLGTAFLNPYKFVSGGLCSRTTGDVTPGNERGVATSRDGESTVIFDGLDFGTFGSNTVTVPIFELGSKPVSVEFWNGDPDSGDTVCLGTAVYHKTSIWNTYQEETFVLEKRLRGVASFALRLHDKIHIKGFSFAKQEKAFQTLNAAENDGLYGDRYTVQGNAVEHIGNNVTLTFNGMDFGESGCSRLVMCGRTRLPVTTVHVRFSGDGGEIRQIADFVHADEYEEQVFTLQKVSGLQTVHFVFLPGSDFDFKYFRFE